MKTRTQGAHVQTFRGHKDPVSTRIPMFVTDFSGPESSRPFSPVQSIHERARGVYVTIVYRYSEDCFAVREAAVSHRTSKPYPHC